MKQAVAAHATRLGEKLRREGLGTDHVTVFFHTSEHDRTRPQRSVSTVVTLPEASNDTLVLVKAALHGVQKTWRDGFRYSKAGVVTTDLLPLHASLRAMPGLGQLNREQGAALMAALDARNRRFGRGAAVPAAVGLATKRECSTEFEMRSLRSTTRLDEIPVAASWAIRDAATAHGGASQSPGTPSCGTGMNDHGLDGHDGVGVHRDVPDA